MSVYNTESALAGDENCPPSPLLLMNSPAQRKTVTDRTPTKVLNSPAQCKTVTDRTPTKVLNSPAQCKTVTDRTPTKVLNSPAQCKTVTDRTPTNVFSPGGLNKTILKPSAYENLLQFTPQPSHLKVITYIHCIPILQMINCHNIYIINYMSHMKLTVTEFHRDLWDIWTRFRHLSATWQRNVFKKGITSKKWKHYSA